MQGKRELKQKKTGFWRRLYTLFTVVAVLVALGISAYAEYTRSSRAKRVIGAYESVGSLFSSNYLLTEINANNRRTVYVGSAESIPVTQVAVTICNYAQGNPGKFYSRNIQYTFTWDLVTISNSSTVSYSPPEGKFTGISVKRAKRGDGENDTVLSKNVAYTFSLNGSASSRDTFLIRFDRDMLDPELPTPVYLQLTATPTPAANYADLKPLFVLLDVSERSPRTTPGWIGSWSDSSDPSDLDGLNYAITGTGKGTCTLKWNSTLLTLSDYSRQIVLNAATAPAVDPEKSGWMYVSFSVGSDNLDRYDIQFYPASKGAWTGATQEDDAGNWVQLIYPSN